MAVVLTTNLGRVDLPREAFDLPTRPQDLSASIVDVTIQASDYSSGFSLAVPLAGLGGAAIIGAYVINARIAAGTALFGFGSYSTATGLVRFFTAITNQTTATDYTPANGDIFRLLLIYA